MLKIISNGVTKTTDTNDLEEAMAIAEEWVTYSQDDLRIYDDNKLVALSKWWSVAYNAEIDPNEPVATFGQYGYYASWQTDDLEYMAV